MCVTSPGFITSAPNRFEFPSNDCSLKVNVADVNILLIEKISSHRSDNWTHLFIWSEKEMLGESPPIRAVPHHLHPKTNTHSYCDKMTHLAPVPSPGNPLLCPVRDSESVVSNQWG